MSNREKSECEGIFEYLSGDGSDMQRKRFERHLATCSDCLEEASLWREVSERLAEDVELLEPPADLKEFVLRPILDNEKAIEKPIKKASRFRTKRFFAGAIGIALLAGVFLSGWLLRDMQYRSTDKAASVQSPASIETLFHLNANRAGGKFNDNPQAYGVACLVKSDSKEQLVVYVFGSPRTKDSEAYQVWLLKNGQRSSAGTFTVGASGIGIMTLPLTKGIPDFDAVGVTLEPDSHSSSPRGPKMFGSSQLYSSGDA
jgi:hypothetical protein